MGNSITLTGTQIPTAVATDPSLCRISGYLKNAHGQPLKGQAFVLRYTYEPMSLSTNTLLMQERLVVKADADGYVEFDLLRGARVTLELPNLLSYLFKSLVVPDAASAGLIDFILPYVAEVQFDDTSPLALEVGERYTISVTGILSNGEEIVLAKGLTIESSDEDVVHQMEGMVFEAVSVGTATLSITEVDTSILALNQSKELVDLVMFDLPDPVLPAPLTVTVS